MASEEDDPRSCVVCGDRATGYHFHALTCEGCKGFFRRTVNKSSGLVCSFTGSCKVNKAQRRHCPACRLQKCLDAGMRKDMILSAEALALRRAKQAQRRAQQTPLQLSKEQKELVQTLLGAHSRHIGTVFHQFVQFRPPEHLFIHHQPSPTLAPVQPLLMHIADINTFMVQQIVKFTKDLPLFRSLSMEDQISLLKGAAVEICHIALNTTFCLQTQNFLCGPLRYTMEDGAHAGFQADFLELLFGFHGKLRRLQLQEPEYVLMAAVALFSPGEHLPNPRNVCSTTSALLSSMNPSIPYTCRGSLTVGALGRPSPAPHLVLPSFLSYRPARSYPARGDRAAPRGDGADSAVLHQGPAANAPESVSVRKAAGPVG
ncbi:nuclear receptor subfamily 1 group I member 3 isoform X1 [Tupaia chinensis]|uniref:nuclear receptor subfamily 1 group I member 3 isoform X1 n=1 Tax=Tupaia chinensis TaxID=246437 RepID=UPI000FFCA165|nr:nuclear receptor subfamily 1 group I member 3 isoform X1 [Tupaia chinensis]